MPFSDLSNSLRSGFNRIKRDAVQSAPTNGFRKPLIRDIRLYLSPSPALTSVLPPAKQLQINLKKGTEKNFNPSNFGSSGYSSETWSENNSSRVTSDQSKENFSFNVFCSTTSKVAIRFTNAPSWDALVHHLSAITNRAPDQIVLLNKHDPKMFVIIPNGAAYENWMEWARGPGRQATELYLS